MNWRRFFKPTVDEGSEFAAAVRRAAMNLEAEGMLEITRDSKNKHVSYKLTPAGREYFQALKNSGQA